MIRKAKERDFLDILSLSEEFWLETEYEEEFDPTHVLEMVKLSYNNDLLCVLDLNGVKGFIAGVVAPLLGSPKALVAAEVGFYILPKYRGNGLKLMRFYESQVASKGIKYNSMMSLQSCDPERANRLYEGMGYHLSEMTYLKVMSWQQ